MNGSPLMKGKKKSGVLITINDITLQKQLETIRQDFVANVSHELKTPITSIIGYLEIIQQGNADIDQQNIFIQKVLDHTNRMNSIIDDLLKLSKIESQEEDNTIELNVKHIALVHNGEVRVTPSKDHETCFTFSIPLSDTL